MTYSRALSIAHELASLSTRPAKLLRAKMKQTSHEATFLIMRYGDPRRWEKLPQSRGRHRKNITLKRVVHTTRKSKDWRFIVSCRPCSLEHAMSGRVISAPSIVEFCRRAKLNHSRYHITPILNGERVTHKGWYRPDFLSRKLNLKDIYGNVYQMTVREWVRRGRSGVQAYRLLSGKTRSEVGSRIMLASTEVTSLLRPRDCHTLEVKLTDGKRVFAGTSIHGAARAAGHTQAGALYQVAYGFRDEARGLRVKSIKVEKKRVLI